jgi:hypothetical protein
MSGPIACNSDYNMRARIKLLKRRPARSTPDIRRIFLAALWINNTVPNRLAIYTFYLRDNLDILRRFIPQKSTGLEFPVLPVSCAAAAMPSQRRGPRRADLQ